MNQHILFVYLGLGEAQIEIIYLSPNPYGSRTVDMIYYLEISFPETIPLFCSRENERKN
jgi:hypothetical protein